MNLAIVSEPLRGIPVRRVDVLKRNREVYEVEVEVVEAPVRELSLCRCFGLRQKSSEVGDSSKIRFIRGRAYGMCSTVSSL